MENDFLKKDIMDLIQILDKKSQMRLNLDLKYLGNPKTVEEFLNILKKYIDENNHLVMRCFKFIEILNCEKLFSFIMDIVPNLKKTIQMEYALHSLMSIPNDKNILEKYLPIIIDIMKKNNDPKIIYQGVYLIYRMTLTCPQLNDILHTYKFNVHIDVFQNTLEILKNYGRWEPIFHNKINKKIDINNANTFLEFSSKFICF